MKITIKDISANALVAALYVVITVLSSPLSYGAIQFRIAEALMILCFFNKKYTIGLTLGCLIANIFSTVSAVDIIIGTAATLISCIAMGFCKQLAVACIIPVVANGLIVGFEIEAFFNIQGFNWADWDWSRFWLGCGTVALGELAVLVLGYIAIMLLKKRKRFFQGILANQNLDFKW